MPIKLTINGRELTGREGQTILDIAGENGIEIPTLCHDPRTEIYGACGLCVVEAEGSAKLLRACATMAADGMQLYTDTPRVRSNRKAALELLLSDHTGDCRPPCMLACPAQTDCQGYVGLIANGEYGEALKLVKDKIPLPASIGRVCPHPCEDACRRQLAEEPISIAALKAYVGDLDLQGKAYTPDIAPESGKSAAVIGGGPGGLTAAYFLRAKGHAVTIYDAMPHMGGMLRYGIPEYRLPKALLQTEIDVIASMGIAMKNNVRVGRDITLDALRGAYDAVIVAVGAWVSAGLRCSGEELEGVLGGIDFLRDTALGKPIHLGETVAVVGGGNTAMDACRTALRLGAKQVYNIYRRTRSEMPAEDIEIDEAEQEGVIFKNLTNPIEILGEGGRVNAVRLQIMELGEPDASGRRRPIAVEGAEETLAVDTVIAAIGQKTNSSGLEGLELTRWGTIAANEGTCCTNLPGVFAVGDATNDGADIAITAIGEAKTAAEAVDMYLRGQTLDAAPAYLVKSEKTAEDFADIAKAPRVKMQQRCAQERRKDFLEVNQGFSEEEAKREAMRCLECGCMDYFECKLIRYANDYRVQPEQFSGKTHHRSNKDDHPYLQRDADKCILCGLCVRVCDEAVGAAALGLAGRGFDTIVKPALDRPLRETDCIACGQCAAVCPTGALAETQAIAKQVPVQENSTPAVCAFCCAGCQTVLKSKGSLLLRSLPAEGALLCKKGRFGFSELALHPRILSPMIEQKESGFEQAIAYTNQALQQLQSRYGKESVAFAVSDRCTNEEAQQIQCYAQALGAKAYSFNRTHSGLADVTGRDSSTVTLDELEQTPLIVLLSPGVQQQHGSVAMRIQRAVKRGAQLLTLEPNTLQPLLKAMIQLDSVTVYDGMEALRSSLQAVTADDQAIAMAKTIIRSGGAVYVFAKNAVTAEAARCIGNMALLSWHGSGARNGILQLLPGVNSQGLSNMGFLPGEQLTEDMQSGKVKGLFIFGENPQGVPLETLAFLAVQELYMTHAASLAHVVFPAASFAESSGSFTAADGRIQSQNAALPCPLAMNNIQLAEALLAQSGRMPAKIVKDLPTGERRFMPIRAGEPLLRPAYWNTNALCTDFMARCDEAGC